MERSCAAAANKAISFLEDWSTAAGAAIIAAQTAECVVAREGTPAEKEALAAIASAGREASRKYDWSATEGAAMRAASAAGERALNDGATAEAALAAAAAAWGAVPLVEDWSIGADDRGPR